MASGSTEASAAAASAQPASMIGKAPSARSAATTSTAGLSATTTNGPCSAMAGYGTRGKAPDNSQCAVNGALNVVLETLEDSGSYDPKVFNGVTGFTNPVIFCSRRSRLARPDAILSAKRV